MFGKGVLKGLRVTLKEFVNTYVDDVKKIPSRYAGGREVIDQTQNLDQQEGLFTIQYPEERRKLPERFRYIPMLIYEAETGEDRCTACGICAKVCPPQCIWIVRDRDANGKPITQPSEFYIDASICMNCGLCAEFCPFDAIKMNHDFEITAYERMPSLVFDLEELTRADHLLRRHPAHPVGAGGGGPSGKGRRWVEGRGRRRTRRTGCARRRRRSCPRDTRCGAGRPAQPRGARAASRRGACTQGRRGRRRGWGAGCTVSRRACDPGSGSRKVGWVVARGARSSSRRGACTQGRAGRRW